MLPEEWTIEGALGAALGAASVICLLRALFILRYRTPARATLTWDGYGRMMRERNTAIFMRERAPKPLTVEDAIAFTTSDGREMRVVVRRFARPHERDLVVWYSPSRPDCVSTAGPLSWFLACVGCIGTLGCLLLG